MARHGEVLASFEGVDETVRSPAWARWSHGGSRPRFGESVLDSVQEDGVGQLRRDFSHFNLTHNRHGPANGPAHAARL